MHGVPSRAPNSGSLRSGASRLRILAIFLLATGLLLSPLLVPLPESFIRWMVLANDSWILNDYSGAEGGASGLRRGYRRFVANFLEFHLVRRVRNQVRVPPGASDAERIVAIVSPLTDLLINQRSVPHRSLSRSALISGVGYCDQLNGVAGKLLAGDFDKSQLFALYDPRLRSSPHTIGRVWSKQYSDWLYFDIFYDETICFRYGQGGKVTYIARASPLSLALAPAPDEHVLSDVYRLVAGGWVMNEYRKTFLGSLLVKLRKHATPPIAGVAGVAGVAGSLQPAPSLSRPEARAYLRARLDQILGRPRLAEMEYLRLTASEERVRKGSKTIESRAAKVFALIIANTLDGPSRHDSRGFGATF